MIDLHDLADAVPLTSPPPLEAVERRAIVLRRRRRRAFAAAASCAVMLLIGVAGLVVARPTRNHPSTIVSAADPLSRKLAAYGPELTYEPAPRDAIRAPEGIVSGTFRVLGSIEGDPVVLYDRPGDEFGPRRSCIFARGAASEIEGCTRTPAPSPPSTSAVGGGLVWENVPPGTVAVGLRDLERRRWQRPQGSLVYFPIRPGNAWFEFEIKAFAADGTVLASEFYRGGTLAGHGGTLRWRDERGVLRSRNHGPEAPPSLPAGDPVFDGHGEMRGTTGESVVLPSGHRALVVRDENRDFAGYLVGGALGFVDFDIANDPPRLRELERCLRQHTFSTGATTSATCRAAMSDLGLDVGR